jgi:TetR/AcrR family transcriptional regulator
MTLASPNYLKSHQSLFSVPKKIPIDKTACAQVGHPSVTAAGNLGVRAERTRRAILQAAEPLFAERGFASTRLEDVAERVGIRRASLVYYFKNKSELYREVLNGVFTELLHRHERALGNPGSLAERVERSVNVWVDYVVERPSVMRLMLREVADGKRSSVPEALATHMAPVFAELIKTIQQGQSDGEMRAIDPMHFLMTTAGATIFVLLGTVHFAPEAPPAIPHQVELHRRELQRLTRSMLGIQGPRLVRKRHNQ